MNFSTPLYHDSDQPDPGFPDNLPAIIRGANNEPIAAANNHPTRNENRMRFDEAADQIVEHGRGLASVKVPLSQLRVSGDRLISADGEFPFGEEGLRKLAAHFHAPFDYLAKLSPSLRDQVLTYHLRTAPEPNRNRIYHRDGKFVDLGRLDLYTLDSARVLDAVRDGFGASLDFEVQRLEIEDESFGLDLVTPRLSLEVRPGDEIQAGVRVEHSYTGDRATTIFGFVVRLICTNGMVYRECTGVRKTQRTRRLNADRDDAWLFQFNQIKRLAEDVRRDIEPKLEAIKKLADKQADEKQLRLFLSQARMNSRGMVGQLMEAWREEGDEPTQFGLFNALTRLATHGTNQRYREEHPREPVVSARQRLALTRLAGVYANHANHICPHCFSVLNAPVPT